MNWSRLLLAILTPVTLFGGIFWWRPELVSLNDILVGGSGTFVSVAGINVIIQEYWMNWSDKGRNVNKIALLFPLIALTAGCVAFMFFAIHLLKTEDLTKTLQGGEYTGVHLWTMALILFEGALFIASFVSPMWLALWRSIFVYHREEKQ